MLERFKKGLDKGNRKSQVSEFSELEQNSRKPTGYDRGLTIDPIYDEPQRKPQRDLVAEFERAGLLRPAGQMTRRAVLAGGGALVISGLGTADYFKGYTVLGRFLNDKLEGQYSYDEVVREAKALMKERYNIDLHMGMPSDEKDITGKQTSLEKYRPGLQVVLQEMSRYPREMVHKVGDGRGFEIWIAEKLNRVEKGTIDESNPEHNHTYWSGFAPQLRDNMPARIIVTADDPEDQQRQNFHHELNHRFAGRFESREKRDLAWAALHAPLGGILLTPYRPVSSDGHHEEWFLTNYAGIAAVEDQAVTAEFMLTPKLHIDFLRRIRKLQNTPAGKVLTAKYNRVKSEYKEWSEAKIGQQFWDRIIDQGLREDQKGQN